MKEVLSRILGNGATKVGGEIADLVDRFVHTKEEKAQFEKEMNEIFLNAEADMQRNITERWSVDMKSDTWLAKNVRPLVLLFLVVSTVIIAID